MGLSQARRETGIDAMNSDAEYNNLSAELENALQTLQLLAGDVLEEYNLPAQPAAPLPPFPPIDTHT